MHRGPLYRGRRRHILTINQLISFDIDGTLEVGDPPGPITVEMVRRAKEMGYVVGSASDRPVPVQKGIWERHGVVVDFTVHKHNLDTVKAQFADVESYLHIGDTNMDEYYAKLHGFDYLDVAKMEDTEWMRAAGTDATPPDVNQGTFDRTT